MDNKSRGHSRREERVAMVGTIYLFFLFLFFSQLARPLFHVDCESIRKLVKRLARLDRQGREKAGGGRGGVP